MRDIPPTTEVIWSLSHDYATCRCTCGEVWFVPRVDYTAVDNPAVLFHCPECARVEQMAKEPLDGEVVGYRMWALTPHGLASSNSGMHTWHLGENHAKCLATRYRMYRHAMHEWGGPQLPADTASAIREIPPDTDHRAPDRSCECGLYAVHGPWDNALGHFFCDGPRVYGAVSAWGKVEVHHHGFRAEHATVVAIAASPDDMVTDPDGRRSVKSQIDGIRAMAEEFGVAFVRREDLPDVAADHGDPIPPYLIPPAPSRPEDPPFVSPFMFGTVRILAAGTVLATGGILNYQDPPLPAPPAHSDPE
jgi:hypothetical protein